MRSTEAIPALYELNIGFNQEMLGSIIELNDLLNKLWSL